MILTTALLLIAAVLAVTLLYGKRTNILLIGLESTRTDTMIVVSLDPKNNEADLISVPRDTYHPVEGKDGPRPEETECRLWLQGWRGQ